MRIQFVTASEISDKKYFRLGGRVQKTPNNPFSMLKKAFHHGKSVLTIIYQGTAKKNNFLSYPKIRKLQFKKKKRNNESLEKGFFISSHLF